jgi:hypothetical protein
MHPPRVFITITAAFFPPLTVSAVGFPLRQFGPGRFHQGVGLLLALFG